MSDGAGAICHACKITRPIDALIAVTDRETGKRRYACRPTKPSRTGQEPCFRAVARSAAEDDIAFASTTGRIPRPEPKAGRRGAFDIGGYVPVMAAAS